MAKKRTLGKKLASGLTSIFMSVAIISQTMAAPRPEPPPSPFPDLTNSFCAQTITQDELQRRTGYTDLDDFLLASAYAKFMAERQRNPQIIHAIINASEQTGVDFKLMLVKAMLESDLGKYDRPLHVNGGARGLYQFLPSTWLTLFAWFGDEYKNGKYASLAAQIKFSANRTPYVDNEAVMKRILDMRFDPYISAFIKAYQIKHDEAPVLRSMTGREPNITDFYIVHFLGIPRARVFYDQLQRNPNRAAARVMSKEARYNRPVFYRGGRARSFAEVYERLERIINDRLETASEVSEDVLAQNRCTPALTRNTPPDRPGARLRMAENAPRTRKL